MRMEPANSNPLGRSRLAMIAKGQIGPYRQFYHVGLQFTPSIVFLLPPISLLLLPLLLLLEATPPFSITIIGRKEKKKNKMPRGSISPNVGLFVDTGNSLLNRSIDGFLRIGIVGAAKAAVEEAYHFTLGRGKISTRNLQHSLKKICSEGVLWGSVAGVYLGMEYGVAGFRGTRDWKNFMIGGALTGAIISAVTNGNKEKVVFDAIRGGALATAVLFLHYYT